jgi:DNA mismatch endonuclease (patch repair protein)
MPDVFSKAKRSSVMAQIKGKGNCSTEIAFAKLLRSKGITGWRRHALFAGTPDFSFKAQKIAIFVDGCFWHGCPKCYVAPKTRSRFWKCKIEGNKARDKKVNGVLKAAGFKVIRIMECRLERNPSQIIQRIHALLGSNSGNNRQ